jgi:hypothetical protein
MIQLFEEVVSNVRLLTRPVTVQMYLSVFSVA